LNGLGNGAATISKMSEPRLFLVSVCAAQQLVAADTLIEAPIDAGLCYESRLVSLGYSANPRAAEFESVMRTARSLSAAPLYGSLAVELWIIA
jgi:hypothetical protein